MSEAEQPVEVDEAEAPEMDAKSTGEKLAAMVEAEASQYETEPEPDEPPEDEPEITPDRIDPLTAALGRYIGEISQILGEEVPIIPCPYCQGKGFEPMLLAKDPHSEVCPECNGYGQVATGSYVQGNEVRMCSNCNGAGYKLDTPTAATLPASAEGEPLRVLTPEEVERIAADARAKVEAFSA
jgi:hypothetical protein